MAEKKEKERKPRVIAEEPIRKRFGRGAHYPPKERAPPGATPVTREIPLEKKLRNFLNTVRRWEREGKIEFKTRAQLERNVANMRTGIKQCDLERVLNAVFNIADVISAMHKKRGPMFPFVFKPPMVDDLLDWASDKYSENCEF